MIKRGLWVALFFLACGTVAWADDVFVGDSSDACDGDEIVKVASRTGTVEVKRNDKNVPIELPALSAEFHWYCGGSRERAANDQSFNLIKASRAQNGAISWKFFRRSSANPPSGGGGGNVPPSLVRVGDTNDACDASHQVTFAGTPAGNVAAGATQLVKMAAPSRELSWRCGDSDERVANPTIFDWVQVERAGNGAIKWVFYRQLATPTEDSGRFFHNLPGTMVVAAILANGGTFPLNDNLKTRLDPVWTAKRPLVKSKVEGALPASDTLQVDSITVANTGTTELRLREERRGLVLKYVAHENRVDAQVKVGAIWCKVSITFDIDLLIELPRTTTAEKGLVATRALGIPRHLDYELEDQNARTWQTILNPQLRAKMSTIAASRFDLTQEVNDALKALFDTFKGSIPAADKVLTMDIEKDGRFTFCAAPDARTRCNFVPAQDPVRIPPRTVLDSDDDDCSQGMIWIWDAELAKYVSVAKGKSGVEVELDSRRFDWYCGDATEPNTLNDEKATGPTGTFAVRVKRDASGRTLHWQFLSWK